MNRLEDLCGRVMSSQALSDAATDCRVLRIAFSSPEQARSRREAMRSRSRPTGKISQLEDGAHDAMESMNELHVFRLLDCDPRVTVLTEQPCEVVYFDGT